MDHTVNEVLQFVQENDVKFVRLVFCDIFGALKNISILAEELPRAFRNGITFDASAVRGFMHVEESDLFLYPDPATLAVLPWRPQQGRVVRFFCDIKKPDGSVFEGDGRHLVREAMARAQQMGYRCQAGMECEFYLFEANDRGLPTTVPQDDAGYLDVAPLDKGENVRREICLTLEEMGIHPESSLHEQGPGQNEIDFHYSDPLEAADSLATFKMVVKTVASRNGLFASFLPKPLPEHSGSGLHINLSLSKNGENLFKNGPGEHSAVAESFIAGVMNRVREITAFLNPLTNSYKRLGSFEAPRYVTWSHQNRSPLIRIPAADTEHCRMELRSADPAANPYLAIALALHAGLEGVEQKLILCEPTNINLYTADPAQLSRFAALPATLEEAVAAARRSEFVRAVLPQRIITNYLDAKQAEWEAYCASSNRDSFEKQTYFNHI